MRIPVENIIEELVQHLLEGHGVPPEKLSYMLSLVHGDDLAGFLVKTHLILHSVEKYGEYQDDQFRFIMKDEDV